jgi:hypothetical protein
MPEDMDAGSGDSRVPRFTKIAGRVLLGLVLIAVAIYRSRGGADDGDEHDPAEETQTTTCSQSPAQLLPQLKEASC